MIEYKVLSFANDYAADQERAINREAKDGWELLWVIGKNYYLKRDIRGRSDSDYGSSEYYPGRQAT